MDPHKRPLKSLLPWHHAKLHAHGLKCTTGWLRLCWGRQPGILSISAVFYGQGFSVCNPVITVLSAQWDSRHGFVDVAAWLHPLAPFLTHLSASPWQPPKEAFRPSAFVNHRLPPDGPIWVVPALKGGGDSNGKWCDCLIARVDTSDSVKRGQSDWMGRRYRQFLFLDFSVLRVLRHQAINGTMVWSSMYEDVFSHNCGVQKKLYVNANVKIFQKNITRFNLSPLAYYHLVLRRTDNNIYCHD